MTGSAIKGRIAFASVHAQLEREPKHRAFEGLVSPKTSLRIPFSIQTSLRRPRFWSRRRSWRIGGWSRTRGGSSGWRCCRRGRSGFGLDGEKFNFENEAGVRADVASRTARAVGQVGRNKDLPFRAGRHELQRFRPTLDDPADIEGRRLAALVRTVELRAIEQRSAVVDGDRVAGGGLGAGALLKNLVLETVGKCGDTLFRFIRGQELLAFFLVGLAKLLHLCFLFLAQLFLLSAEVRLQCL